MNSSAQGYSFAGRVLLQSAEKMRKADRSLKTCVSCPFASIPMSLGTPEAVG
jgi:hypothetical protein